MDYGDEVDVLEFFKTTLDTQIDVFKATVVGWGDLDDEQEADLNISDKRILWVSRLSVLIDPDEEFAIQDKNTNKSSPTLLIGLTDTISTLNSAQGNMIYGDNSFDFVVIVAKHNRVYAEWMREVTAIRKFLTDVFIASTGKRIFVKSIRWSDYVVGDIPGSGFTLSINTSINNYDYQVN